MGAGVLIATRTDAAAAPTPPSIDESRARNAVAPVGVYPLCARRAFQSPRGPRIDRSAPEPRRRFRAARPTFFHCGRTRARHHRPYAVSSRGIVVCPTAEKREKMTSVKVLAALFLYACTVRECAQHDNEPVKTVL